MELDEHSLSLIEERFRQRGMEMPANNRKQAEADLTALADEDMNQLGRFLDPRFRVHPELQKLARQVMQLHLRVASHRFQQRRSEFSARGAPAAAPLRRRARP